MKVPIYMYDQLFMTTNYMFSSSLILLVLWASSLYCWSYFYTVGLLAILLVFSLYCWPSPYTVGLLPILLVFSPTDFMEAGQGSDLIGLSFELSIFKSHGSPSYSYIVALLHLLLAFSPTVYYLKEASH